MPVPEVDREGAVGEVQPDRPVRRGDPKQLLQETAAVRVPRRERAHLVARGTRFGDANVLVTPAVVGEAPEGLDSTGDPRFCRLWTLLGLPTVVVPGQVGATGLPIGVQLVGRPNADAHVVGAAGLLALALS